jgi:hypothetical protein
MCNGAGAVAGDNCVALPTWKNCGTRGTCVTHPQTGARVSNGQTGVIETNHVGDGGSCVIPGGNGGGAGD